MVAASLGCHLLHGKIDSSILKFHKDNMRWVTHGYILSRELKLASFFVNFESADVIGSLISAVQETTARIKAETARIIPSSPFIVDKAKQSIFADRENTNTVVEAVAGVEEFSIL